MIEIKNLSITINDHKLIEDLNFCANSGDKIAIIGEEGNGKSTLLKVIMNDASYCDISGEIYAYNTHFGYLKQILDTSKNNQIVKDFLFLNEADYFLSINDSYKYMDRLKLDDTLLTKKMRILSGGEKVKVQILQLLLGNPDILLLDEPSNDLDIETLQWLEEFIIATPLPILLISHDETLLSNCANKILHIEQLNKQSKCKHTLLKGTYDEYLKQRYSKRSKYIQIAKKEKVTYMKKKEKLNNISNALHDSLNDTVRNPAKGALLKKKMHTIKAMQARFDKEGYAKVDTIEENIKLIFKGTKVHTRKEILNLKLATLKIRDIELAKNISLKIYGPKHIAIVGSNGCGKSTLLKRIYDELINRSDISLGYMPQDYNSVMDLNINGIEFINPGKEKARTTLLRQYLGNLNFTSEEMTFPIAKLSGGSKAKLLLLKLMVDECDVLILDEPTRNISPLSNPIIRNALKSYGGCIICVSHDRLYLREVCSEIYELNENGLTLLPTEKI